MTGNMMSQMLEWNTTCFFTNDVTYDGKYDVTNVGMEYDVFLCDDDVTNDVTYDGKYKMTWNITFCIFLTSYMT